MIYEFESATGPRQIALRMIHECHGIHAGESLIIAGPGPSFDFAPSDLFEGRNVFALNAAITEFVKHPKTIWISNDHDRTWGNPSIREGFVPLIEDYAPWSTTANRKFVPGKFGDIEWTDHRGRRQKPMTWRLDPPEESTLWWYSQNEGEKGYLRNGYSSLEFAFEVATIFGFDRIVLVGVDLCFVRGKDTFVNPRRSFEVGKYYAKKWSWKDIPAKMKGGKFVEMRRSITQNLDRWPVEIFTMSPYLDMFRRIDVSEACRILG